MKRDPLLGRATPYSSQRHTVGEISKCKNAADSRSDGEMSRRQVWKENKLNETLQLFYFFVEGG